jgi:sec-independent protein translocase protein TatA
MMPFFLNIGSGELFVIILFIIIFFGSKNIPELARGLGKGIREFKTASDSVKREITESVNKMSNDVEVKRKEIQELKSDLDQKTEIKLDQIADENNDSA